MATDRKRFTFNKTEIATLFGVTTEAVNKWMHAGCPDEGKHGRAVQFYAPDVIKWRTQGVETETGQVLNLAAERAKLAKEQADKAAMENAILRGDLVRVSDLETVWAAVAVAVKSKLLSIPTKVAANVAEHMTANEVQELIDKAIREALEELSDKPPGVGAAKPIQQEAEATAEVDSKSMG